MSSSKLPTLKLNLRRTMMCRIEERTKLMLEKKRTARCVTIANELHALAELNYECPNSSQEDRESLDELNAYGHDLKRELGVLLRNSNEQPAMSAGSRFSSSPLSAANAAHEVLREADTPLHYEEITERALKSGRWVSRGRTPSRTINSVIVTEMARSANSRFVRVRSGVYGLREWADRDKIE